MPDDVDELLKRDSAVFDAFAASYGRDSTHLLHAIPTEAEELYRQDIEDVLGPFTGYKSVLEVGVGNGIFTQLLDRWGCETIIGTDISEGMLRIAQASLPQSHFKHVTKECEPDLFPNGSFDLIISRQLVCHLIDPINVFDCWKLWLRPDGKIAVIDGMWKRDDWGPPGSMYGNLADERPLSCTQTSSTLSYLLQRAGLTIKHRGLLNRVNDFAKQQYAMGQPREPIFRYLVVATAEQVAGLTILYR